MSKTHNTTLLSILAVATLLIFVWTPAVGAQSAIDTSRDACLNAVQSALLRGKSFEPVATTVKRYNNDIASVAVSFHARVVIGIKAKNSFATCTLTGLSNNTPEVCDLIIYTSNTDVTGTHCSSEVRQIVNANDNELASFMNWKGAWNKKKRGPEPTPYQPTSTSDGAARSRATRACQQALDEHSGIGQLEATDIEVDQGGGKISWFEGKAAGKHVYCTVVDRESPRACNVAVSTHPQPYEGTASPTNQVHVVEYVADCKRESDDWYYPLMAYRISKLNQ